MTSPAPTRRRLLTGGAAITGAAVIGQAVNPSAAHAATIVRPYAATSMPTPLALHYLNRLGCGYSRTSFAELQAAGGPDAWFAQQLDAESVPETAKAASLASWFPHLGDSMPTRYANNKAKTYHMWDYARDLSNYSVLRRMYSSRSLLENMVDFWSNHLNVCSMASRAWVARREYDDVIRTHALGRYEDLLLAASLHPALLMYLNNCESKRGAPNENQGRELLELHTVGQGAGYTEAMVKDSAKILSGWTVALGSTWQPYYDGNRHTTGAVQVLGFSAANGSADSQLAARYLRYLANHPATARRIATKLCRRFVAEQPSSAIVGAVADAYLASGTDIKASLRALVSHPDFAASQGQLYRDPVEDFVATCRAMDVQAKAPTVGTSFANKTWQIIRSIPVYQWPRPDGMPPGSEAWISAGRMLNSFRMHWQMAAGWAYTTDATYRSAASWLPQSSIALDLWVDHLCRMILGRSATPVLIDAVVTGTGYPAGTVVTSSHKLAGPLFPRVVGALLDTPDHMRR